MDRKYIIFTILAFLIIFIYLFFFREQKIKNFPSSGTDIIAFGDSLIEGVGATVPEANFVSLLSKRIGKPIINLGVSGNTTRDGLARIDEIKKYNPKVVILLLGGNDYLKKVPEDETFNNLEKIIKYIQSRGSIVLLLGIRGGLLTDRFDDKFEDLKNKTSTAFVTNVLSGLLLDNRYMSDAIHPNDEGYKKIADRIYPVLVGLINEK